MIISFIMIVGLVQAGKDEGYFKYAFYALIAYFVIYVIISIAFGNSDIKGYGNAVSTFFDLLVTVLMIQGIINLANKLQNGEVATKGLLVFKLIICVNILAIIVRIIDAVTKNIFGRTVEVIIAIAIIVLSVAKYLIYLSLLSKAKKMLAEKAE